MSVQRIGDKWEVHRAGEPPLFVSISRPGHKFMVSSADTMLFDSRELAEAFAESVAQECNKVQSSFTQLFGDALDEYSDSVKRTGWRRAMKNMQQLNKPVEE